MHGRYCCRGSMSMIFTHIQWTDQILTDAHDVTKWELGSKWDLLNENLNKNSSSGSSNHGNNSKGGDNNENGTGNNNIRWRNAEYSAIIPAGLRISKQWMKQFSKI